MEQCALSTLIPVLSTYLTIEEEAAILAQFKRVWRCDKQLLWSGLSYDIVQSWAKRHEIQTLTVAMGPLMDKENPSCRRKTKGPKDWSKYIKGASALFAWCISKGRTVMVLTPPPPEKFHPSGFTNYQTIEEPVLRWAVAGREDFMIKMLHPIVKLKATENFSYQVWPVDETEAWTARFGMATVKKSRWRQTAASQIQTLIKSAIEALKSSGITSMAGCGGGSSSSAPSSKNSKKLLEGANGPKKKERKAIKAVASSMSMQVCSETRMAKKKKKKRKKKSKGKEEKVIAIKCTELSQTPQKPKSSPTSSSSGTKSPTKTPSTKTKASSGTAPTSVVPTTSKSSNNDKITIKCGVPKEKHPKAKKQKEASASKKGNEVEKSLVTEQT
ncbi:hypothetical protein B0J11DRAFT_209448 [Dendryphion nanum]|uniref:Uncharacterized protein n=1 Tax=Dendryphion nanum TaxID=256645 RepID=A0A9P9E8E7_9PLEO|nr:hypothetical protein B0J11DRAFT_209448 [Dendryphion nanum]